MAQPNYFREFPTIEYKVDLESNKTYQMRNIMIRSRIVDAVKDKDRTFYPYTIRDFDRPDTIAEKYYGSSEYYWVVLYSNSIFDVYTELPMHKRTFDAFLAKKYESYTLAADAHFGVIAGSPGNAKDRLLLYLNEVIHHYEDGDGMIVDLETYVSDPNPNKKIVSIFDYEFKLNESKREIKLLDSRLLQQFVSEIEDSLKDNG